MDAASSIETSAIFISINRVVKHSV